MCLDLVSILLEILWVFLCVSSDVESPKFSNGCPHDLAVDAAPVGSDTTVSWSPPDVTDNSGDVVNLQSDVIPGSNFPSGVTNVTYTAVDVTGNTAVCAFSVTVTGV